MIFGPIDARTPNAPAWAGHRGWAVYAVTSDAADAAARAVHVAADLGAPLAPGTWPVDTPADTQRIGVGPVYVAVRTRHGHQNGVPLATYYVLRRSTADEEAQPPDPSWPVPPAPAAWPFVAVGRRTSRAGAKPLGADIVTWRGRLGGHTITFSTQPRRIDPHALFEGTAMPANARIHDTSLPPEFVDVLVHHPLAEAERAQLAALAQAQDARPVIVRCVGEPLRGAPARRAATGSDPGAPRFPAGAGDERPTDA
jgi:hypothetical protein